MKRINQLAVTYNGDSVGTLTLSPDNRFCVFEYDKGWLLNGFSISPLELPLRSGSYVAKAHPFNGGFGIFEDSLPDGYGRYLLHKTLMKEGINDQELSTLDRLSIVGSGGMGALSYSPVTQIIMGIGNDDLDLLQTKALEVLKEKQDDDAELLLFNSGNSGGARPKTMFADTEGHWLVKFRHIYDPKDIGLQEFNYNEAARKCGIDVPDFKLINGRYFASKRFDIGPDGKRRHVATAGGLLGVALGNPILDYSNLLALTGYLTQNPDEVEEMFRRMVFNYLVDNKDDHCKNFSFLVVRDSNDQWCWKLAPAYDLTLNSDGYNGEHATSVNGTGAPTLADFIAVGEKIHIARPRCLQLIEQVTEGARPLIRYRL